MKRIKIDFTSGEYWARITDHELFVEVDDQLWEKISKLQQTIQQAQESLRPILIKLDEEYLDKAEKRII